MTNLGGDARTRILGQSSKMADSLVRTLIRDGALKWLLY